MEKEEFLHRKVSDFVQKTLGGSVSPLFSYFSESKNLSPQEIEQLKALVEKMEGDEMNNLSSLDFIWRFLVLFTVIAAISYSIGILVHRLLKGHSPSRLKWFLRIVLVQLAVFGVTGLIFLNENNPFVDCFQVFAASAGALSVTRLLSAAWVAVTLFLLSLDVMFFLRSYRLSKSWKVTDNAELKSLVEELKGALDVTTPFKVVLSSEQTSPFAFGFMQRHLVIPEALLEKIK